MQKRFVWPTHTIVMVAPMGMYKDGSKMLPIGSGSRHQNPALRRKRLLAKTQQRNPNLGNFFGGYVVGVENHGMQMQKPASAFLVNIVAAQAVGQLEDDDDVSHQNVN
ncbi:hypothetical protein RIB2604_02000610 [Aspergillus luchuensis]|uniref:Uncharacterized protein n=1 Tax=Aspergillus kawachii TaxID=1069201 RepID=A0A146FGZ6_ASPKA|nr:hypothetical protein ALUC_50582S [Aspergillus luchuensis]GAT25484.1 hypothetical protein RIB2604_02000610 [Aspergillus luchuensis]